MQAIYVDSYVWMKAIKQWFSLKAKVRQPKQYKIRGINWNYRTVAAVLKKQEVKQAEVELAGKIWKLSIGAQPCVRKDGRRKAQ
jgi:hypothetical protein